MLHALTPHAQCARWAGRRQPTERLEVLDQVQHTLHVDTRGPGFTDLTRLIAAWLCSIAAEDGLLTLFVRHTSASLTIQENADPAVLRDLAETLEKLAPRGARYHHDEEGPDDMPGHIKSMLTATSLGLPVAAGKAVLGTWQAVYLIEHRDRPHTRHVVLHYVGTRRDQA
jgi:secondary thiamine-phosphate synthase enzyme